ncbi:TIGR02285 family protein [Alteromonas sp. CYL-A6]|uniref:TIGR02285 family protein n=1 Tax=Alteromonas nitratireducens TaxID=3390813 RepID=UPI0034BAE317
MKALVFVCLLISSQCYAREILWLRPDFPPGTFVSGPMQDKGYNDLARQYIMARLPGYTHHTETAGYERIVSLMTTDNVCIVGLYKSPAREKIILYSDVRGVILPNGVIIRAADRERFSHVMENGRIDIDALLASSEFIGGVSDGRLYKGPVDAALTNHPDAPHVLRRSGPDVFPSLLSMLDRGRIDYTLGFPVELEYQQRLHKTTQPMLFIPVKDMPDATPTYIACSRNAWGEQVIEEINHILVNNRLDVEYLMTYQDWLDKDSAKRHQALSEALFSR